MPSTYNVCFPGLLALCKLQVGGWFTLTLGAPKKTYSAASSLRFRFHPQWPHHAGSCLDSSTARHLASALHATPALPQRCLSYCDSFFAASNLSEQREPGKTGKRISPRGKQRKNNITPAETPYSYIKIFLGSSSSSSGSSSLRYQHPSRKAHTAIDI